MDFPAATDWTQWNHLAFVKNGNTAQIWLNGNVLRSVTGNTQVLLTDFSQLTLGANAAAGSSINGLLDDFAVFHTALSGNNIAILAQGGAPDQFPAPESTWIERNFGTNPANPADTTATADPDQDGYNNLVERALGGNPLQPNPAASLMTWQVIPGTEPPALELEVRPGPDSGDLTISAEASTDLQTWSAANIQRLTTPEGRLRFLDSQPGPRRFLRLRVSP